jgi:hypothetical protein
MAFLTAGWHLIVDDWTPLFYNWWHGCLLHGTYAVSTFISTNLCACNPHGSVNTAHINKWFPLNTKNKVWEEIGR